MSTNIQSTMYYVNAFKIVLLNVFHTSHTYVFSWSV